MYARRASRPPGRRAAADPHLRALSRFLFHPGRAAFGGHAERAGRRRARLRRIRNESHQQCGDRARNPAHARRHRQIRSRDAGAAVPIGYAEPEASRSIRRRSPKSWPGATRSTRTPSRCRIRSTKCASARRRRSKSAGSASERAAARNPRAAGGGSRTRTHRRFDCTIRAGEFIALLGGNGAGKSLLLRTLAGLRARPAARCGWTAATSRPLPRREIATRLGFLPQDPDAPPQGTLRETVLLGPLRAPRVLGSGGHADDARVTQALGRRGLEVFAARELATLSGGEQRRAAIARLLVQAPSIYLLDEPTNHLDPAQQLGILERLRALTRAGAAVIASLHEPNLALRFADRACLLSGNGEARAGRLRGARHRLNSSGSMACAMRRRAWARSGSWRRTEVCTQSLMTAMRSASGIGSAPRARTSGSPPSRAARAAEVPGTRSPGYAAAGRAAHPPRALRWRVAQPPVPLRNAAARRRDGGAGVGCAFAARTALGLALRRGRRTAGRAAALSAMRLLAL